MPRWQRHRSLSMNGSIGVLLVMLSLGPVMLLRAGPPPPEVTSSERLAPRIEVAVHQSRLSVDLWAADLGEVLGQIRRQAGIPIIVSPSATSEVSVQFTDVALDHGLRHLLQLASLSYAMRYAAGPSGEVVLQEVRVFGKGRTGPDPSAAEDAADNRMADSRQRFIDALGKRQAAGPSRLSEEERDLARRFQDSFERTDATDPWPTATSGRGAVHRLREAFEGALGIEEVSPPPWSDRARKDRLDFWR